VSGRGGSRPSDEGKQLSEGPGTKITKEKKDKPQWNVPGTGKEKKKDDSKKQKKEKPVPTRVTPDGEKKDMSEPMMDKYEPSLVESAWGAWWERRQFFKPDAKQSKGTKESKRFIMVIPPPNVTGSLHLGHALTCSIEDALTRWHRMCGDVTLWLPGTDHAGIATQSVVERHLFKTEKKTRHDLGRENFLSRVWEWKEKNGNRICEQLRRTGASVDWSRQRFTMDDMLGKAVKEAFIRFHEQGLIYRDNRLVNWCPYLRTALSDLEVDHEDIPGRTLLTIPGYEGKVEVGVLCEFKYMVKGSKDSLTVATTRLETMLGDVAVAVHPQDERYTGFVGKELVHPFFPTRKMVVVADDMVDRTFGTGCVKITPAHDPNDYKLGKRKGLEQINILTEDGKINGEGGQFAGQHRFEARGTVEEALKSKGLWVRKKTDHAMRLGICSRSKDIIEPFLKPQWWMNCKDLADKSVKALREGELKIIPDFHHQTWYYWLENIQDWCISRQLWWGHRIPAYRVTKPVQSEEKWFSGRTKAEAEEKAKETLKIKSVELEQDEDVLDTWFSSGLFPFSVFGWPDKTEDMDAFFPTSLLETGHDILFFWVARMVMMSIGLTNKLPFHTVYLHAMVRDAHGRKMSKSLGNVVDPLEVVDGIELEDLHRKLKEGNLPEKEIEKAIKGQKADFPEGIPECGADALRFGLLAYTLQGRNVNLDISRVVGYRHFCDKVWQGTKFGLTYFGPDFVYPGSLALGLRLAWEDKWILSRLSDCAEKLNVAFEKYEFANATTAVFSFFKYDFCDEYLELLKPRLHGDAPEHEKDRDVARQVLYTCLDWSLRLMHPLLPYLTEELYQRLPPSPMKAESITISSFPTRVIAWKNDFLEEEMEVVKDIAQKFRSKKTSLNMDLKSRPRGYIRHSSCVLSAAMCKCLSRRAYLSGVEQLKQDAAEPSGSLGEVVNKDCVVYLEVEGVDLSAELTKIQKKIAASEKMIASIQKKLAAPGYADKVPDAIKQKDQTSLEAEQKAVDEFTKAAESIRKATSAVSQDDKKGAAAVKDTRKADSKKAAAGKHDKKATGNDEKKADKPVDFEAERKAKLKKVLKEGGKRGVEIEGAGDMGGLQFFSCSVDEPDGDVELLQECMKAMNAAPIPGEEERKGCSGHIGKTIFSAGTEQLAVVAYVPDQKVSELSCEEWLRATLANWGGEVLSTSPNICTGRVLANSDKGIFPLKIREPMILDANNFLRKKNLFPADDDDDDDEMVFGDDDFPS
jgi:valyl-tRNA synthetase